MPKSATIAWPPPRRMLAGLMSRWMMPRSVRVGQRFGDFARDLERVFDRQLGFALDPLAQGLALHIGHHVVEQSLSFARLVHRQDVGGWVSRAAISTSRRKRSAPRVEANSGRITFTATLRLYLRSWAR